MPQHIKSEHIDRMFPFEFYEELSEQLKSYTLLNPAFILKDELNATTEQRKKLFDHARKNAPLGALYENNLLQVEPFGELLLLEVCCPTDKRKTAIHERDKSGQIPLTILVVQLYDSSGSPVFAKDVDEASVAQIPEVLWDDPNLLLGIVSFTETEPQVAIFKMPERIEERIFETVQDGKDASKKEE